MARVAFFLLAVGLPAAAQWLIIGGRLGGPHLPEMRLLGYTPDQLPEFLAGLGPSGRPWYAWFQVADLFLIAGLAGAMVAIDRWGLGQLVDLAEDLVLLRLIALFDRPR